MNWSSYTIWLFSVVNKISLVDFLVTLNENVGSLLQENSISLLAAESREFDSIGGFGINSSVNNIFAARQAIETLKNYGYDGVERTILLLHAYNLKSIGVNDMGTADASLLKELAVKMVS